MSDAEKAIAAIAARMNDERDNEHLAAIGPLSPSVLNDIRWIIEFYGLLPFYG